MKSRTVYIVWKDLLPNRKRIPFFHSTKRLFVGKEITRVPQGTIEVFRQVKSLEAAEELVAKRQRSNIKAAWWINDKTPHWGEKYQII